MPTRENSDRNSNSAGCVESFLLRSISFRFLNHNQPHTWRYRCGAVALMRERANNGPLRTDAAMIGHAPRPYGDSAVRQYPGISWGTNDIWRLWMRRIGRGGLSAWTEARLARHVVIDDGVIIHAMPNAPTAVTVRASEDYRYTVSWVYNPLDEQASPSVFYLYDDAGSGKINLKNPIAVVQYRNGETRYRFVTAPYIPGSKISFVVRAVTNTGVESLLPSIAGPRGGVHYDNYRTLDAHEAVSASQPTQGPAEPEELLL